MIIRPCPNTINCPGTDEPIQNYSSEAPDGLDFISRQWFGNSPPPFFRQWNAEACGQTFISQISQADADQQAAAAAALCADTGPCIGIGCTGLGGGPPTGGVLCNDAETACVPCPDGTQFCYTVPAGIFCGFGNQARVDSYAHGLAFRLARQKRFCLSSLPTTANCGKSFNAIVTATGPVITPCTWTIVAGMLPPGLTLGGFSPNIDTTLGPTETIQGTPTMGGAFTFTLQCEGSDFSFMQKTYTITVSTCIQPNLLHWSFQNNGIDDNLGVGFVISQAPFVPGLIGQGVNFNNPGGPSQLTIQTPITQVSPYSGGSITFAFWANFSNAGTGFPSTLANLDYNGNDGHVYELDFFVGLGGSGLTNPVFRIQQDPGAFGPVVATVTYPITFSTGHWYFIVCTYDSASGTVRVSINNSGYTVGTNFTLPHGSVPQSITLQNLLGPSFILDEYLITTNYGLGAQDIKCLYNTGSGKAWPYILPFGLSC